MFATGRSDLQAPLVQALSEALEAELNSRLPTGFELLLASFQALPWVRLVGTAEGRIIELKESRTYDTLVSIYINGDDVTLVRVHTEELWGPGLQGNRSTWFEHANPAFPENLLHLVLGYCHETNLTQTGE